MQEETLKRLRFAPVAVALLLMVVLSALLLRTKRNVLVFATGSDVGLYHRLASRIEKAVESSHADVAIELITSAGSTENISRLERKEAQIALVQNDAQGGRSVRSIAALYPEVLHLICRTDKNIRSLGDLKERRIGIGAVGSGTEQLASKLLEFVGVSLDPKKIWRGSFAESLQLVNSGELDGTFVLAGIGAEVVERAMRDERVELVPIQMGEDPAKEAKDIAQEFADGFRIHYPHIEPQTIPLMAYEGRPAAPVPTLSVQAVLVCHEEVAVELVERITRTLFGQRAVLSQQDTAFTHLNEQGAQAALHFPLHEGADNYYRRREPGFLSSNAEAMGFIITMVLLLWSVLVWVRRWYLQRRKNRVDTYYKAIEALSSRVGEVTCLQELETLESELQQISREARGELVEETLAADESYIIYQTMFGDCRTSLDQLRARLRSVSDTA
ncbi:MAG: TAXI family TRAP transporter solute-binding subunit [Planctomycetota bacterium]|nr:TAXI family TRAP transporter solute-binding subunit [Planctomycetota bacterium]